MKSDLRKPSRHTCCATAASTAAASCFAVTDDHDRGGRSHASGHPPRWLPADRAPEPPAVLYQDQLSPALYQQEEGPPALADRCFGKVHDVALGWLLHRQDDRKRCRELPYPQLLHLPAGGGCSAPRHQRLE